jgi:long-chain acyl-CoA synthetase
MAVVPANAKLHGRELAYILEHSGARICFASYGTSMARSLRTHRRPSNA